jgi:hypothetical protein
MELAEPPCFFFRKLDWILLGRFAMGSLRSQPGDYFLSFFIGDEVDRSGNRI